MYFPPEKNKKLQHPWLFIIIIIVIITIISLIALVIYCYHDCCRHPHHYHHHYHKCHAFGMPYNVLTNYHLLYFFYHLHLVNVC